MDRKEFLRFPQAETDGKITSYNGQERVLRFSLGREGWKGIVGTSSVVPRRPSRLMD